MIGWLWRLIIGHFNTCKHDFEIIREVNIYKSETSKLPVGNKFILQCKKCGDLKIVKHTNE